VDTQLGSSYDLIGQTLFPEEVKGWPVPDWLGNLSCLGITTPLCLCLIKKLEQTYGRRSMLRLQCNSQKLEYGVSLHDRQLASIERIYAQ